MCRGRGNSCSRCTAEARPRLASDPGDGWIPPRSPASWATCSCTTPWRPRCATANRHWRCKPARCATPSSPIPPTPFQGLTDSLYGNDAVSRTTDQPTPVRGGGGHLHRGPPAALHHGRVRSGRRPAALSPHPRATTQFWDTSEYIAAAYSLGIPHPPGNPLFVLMAHVWGLIPLVSGYAERINLFAALTSAVSAGCWFLVGERWLRSPTRNQHPAETALVSAANRLMRSA